MSGDFEQAKSRVCQSEGTYVTMRPLASSCEQRKLGSIAASFDYGLNAAATEYDGQNKYLRITDIDDTTHEFLKSDLTTPLADLAMSADYLLEEGDLLFARTGASVGKTYLYRQYDGTVYFAGFLIRARIGESADPEFVYQATLTDAYKKYVAITSQRSGQPGVNAQEYADYQLMLPSRTEQQQIGMTLRSLDNFITLHQRKCQCRSLCGYLSWEQRKLSEVATFGGGHTPSMADSDNYEDGCVLWVTSQDVKSSYLDRTTTQITEKGAKKLTLYPAGSLVMVTRSGILRHTLPVAELRKPSTVNQDIRVILPQDTCCGGWLLQFFISRNKELLLEFGKTGTTVESVDFGKIKDMLLRMPSSVEQQQIGRYFAQLDSLITLHQ